MTWRDCAPAQGDANVSPWDDAYATKNRCKKVNGVRQCTCKEAMCNSGFNTQSSIIVMSVTVIVSLMFGRM